MDEINDITSYINSTYTYLKYISSIDITELDNYFTNIENDAEEIKILTLQFLRNETLLIDKIKTLIKSNFTQIYPNEEKKLKEDVDEVLNTLIPSKLKKLEKKSITYNGKYEDLNITSTYENDNYIISKSFGEIKDINYKSHFIFDYNEVEKLIIFNATLNVTANSKFKTQIDFINEILEGSFVDGELGLNINYSLYDEKAYVRSYAKQNNSTYTSALEIDEEFTDFFPYSNNFTVTKVLPPVNVIVEKKI
jgi:hypothetical protein